MAIYPSINYSKLTNAELQWIENSAAGNIALLEVSTPSGTASGKGIIYVKSSDSKLYYQDDSGSETDLTAGGAGTPGGNDTEIQYNNGSTFAGDSNLTWGSATQLLTITGSANISGKVGIGTTSPLSRLHLAAGTSTANTAPLQFTSGTLETTPRSGIMEFDGSNLYLCV